MSQVRCPVHLRHGRAARRIVGSTVVVLLVLAGYLAWIALVVWVMP